MNDDLRAQLELLERAVADLAKASKAALGFVTSLDYMGISFNVSRRFVIADLSPLAFFHLVEYIDDGPGMAVVNLYERLLPLLSCEHRWTPLRRTADAHVRSLATGRGAGPHICKVCTAYALGGNLPVIGRTLPPTG